MIYIIVKMASSHKIIECVFVEAEKEVAKTVAKTQAHHPLFVSRT